MDRCMDECKKWQIEVGAAPKNLDYIWINVTEEKHSSTIN